MPEIKKRSVPMSRSAMWWFGTKDWVSSRLQKKSTYLIMQSRPVGPVDK